MYHYVAANFQSKIPFGKLIHYAVGYPVGRSANGINRSFSCLPLLSSRHPKNFDF